ncbi:uncharacterized protein LOC131944013 [Physella acuta]|uniref:uncharacterized protein LOC131944013 n=1 Tax=Physella acuta TaxID=109671 RepID=UPI0027DE383E|nr:uncharacterized protein LOC131944013 [Physella acuta]
MSGEIFQPMENPDEAILPTTRNPLLCYLCNEPYEDPCILGCFHSFCAHCLRGRALDGKMSCPLCGCVHTLRDGTSLPPSDLLLKFMIESSTEERAQCANCDSTAVQMFFCNTCSQPLCPKCREETHRAKMFSSHDMVLLTKRAREVHKKCLIHEEPYIMFSSEKKMMLCINCFRDMRIESRGHCLDLETAYTQSFKKLDLRVQAFRELQNSVREGILLFKALLEEIKMNSGKERVAIEELYGTLLERLSETKTLLLQKVDSQYADKEATFRSQLKSLSTLLPTLHVHLVIASAFRGSANKFEFLDFANVLMERLKSIVQNQHPIHPTQSGQIDTAYKTEFFKSLEPLLYVPLQRCTLTSASMANGVNGIHAGSCPGSPVIHRLTPNHTRRTNGLNGAKVKFIDAKGQFAEHCREFENAHRDLLQKLEQMKTQCQELQRDLTMRRCLAKKDEVLALTNRIEAVQNHLEAHYNILEQKMPLLDKHWEESLERLNNEQDLYQAQLQDVMRLKQESQQLRVIASQLTSFVSSIAAVTERLAPKLGQSNQTSEQEQQIASLLEEISSVHPDSQQRVEAIRGAEEERQTNLANRTNPLDSELIKTKGLLRAPSLRSKKAERRKRVEATDISSGTKAITDISSGTKAITDISSGTKAITDISSGTKAITDISSGTKAITDISSGTKAITDISSGTKAITDISSGTKAITDISSGTKAITDISSGTKAITDISSGTKAITDISSGTKAITDISSGTKAITDISSGTKAITDISSGTKAITDISSGTKAITDISSGTKAITDISSGTKAITDISSGTKAITDISSGTKAITDISSGTKAITDISSGTKAITDISSGTKAITDISSGTKAITDISSGTKAITDISSGTKAITDISSGTKAITDISSGTKAITDISSGTKAITDISSGTKAITDISSGTKAITDISSGTKAITDISSGTKAITDISSGTKAITDISSGTKAITDISSGTKAITDISSGTKAITDISSGTKAITDISSGTKAITDISSGTKAITDISSGTKAITDISSGTKAITDISSGTKAITDISSGTKAITDISSGTKAITDISSGTKAITDISSGTKAITDISSGTKAITDISSGTKAITDISSGTKAITDISSGTKAITDISSGTKAITDISSGTKAITDISSGTKAITDISSGTKAITDISSGTKAITDISSGTKAITDISSGTKAITDISSGTKAITEGYPQAPVCQLSSLSNDSKNNCLNTETIVLTNDNSFVNREALYLSDELPVNSLNNSPLFCNGQAISCDENCVENVPNKLCAITTNINNELSETEVDEYVAIALSKDISKSLSRQIKVEEKKSRRSKGIVQKEERAISVKDSGTIRNFLKDVENYNKRDILEVTSAGDCP